MLNRATLFPVLLAATMAIAGCVAQPTQPVNLAFVEAGAAYDMQAPDGGKLSLTLKEPGAARSVLAFSEDITRYTGKLIHTESGKSVEFTLTQALHGATGNKGETTVTFLNLVPGEWKMEDLKAYDRADQAVQQSVTGNVFTIKPYEVTYASVTVNLKDTVLNQDTGAVQANVSTETGDLNLIDEGSNVSPTSYTSVDLPLSRSNFSSLYTAFTPSGDQGKWRGQVEFGVDVNLQKKGSVWEKTTFLAAKLNNGDIIRLAIVDDLGANYSQAKFYALPETALRMGGLRKPAETETIKTGAFPQGIVVQRYYALDSDKKTVTALYLVKDPSQPTLQDRLIAMAFTDGTPLSKQVQIQALSK